jgi:hypothetical protein
LLVCTMDRLIDTGNCADSVILVKLKETPQCPTGGPPGEQMPPPNNIDNVPSPLPPDDVTCIENFVRVFAGDRACL